MNGLYQLARWLQMLRYAPEKWRVVNTSVATVLSWYRMLRDFTMPKSMRAEVKVHVTEDTCHISILR